MLFQWLVARRLTMAGAVLPAGDRESVCGQIEQEACPPSSGAPHAPLASCLTRGWGVLEWWWMGDGWEMGVTGGRWARDGRGGEQGTDGW